MNPKLHVITQRPYWPPVIIVLSVMALYGGFLYLPAVFDDTSFFASLNPDEYLAFDHSSLTPRHLVYASIALTVKWFGNSMLPLRIQGMLLHAGVAIMLYFFLRKIQQSVMCRDGVSMNRWPPLLAAMVFTLHPAAVYAAAYLIQRTIVMATFFALLTWFLVLKGLQTKKKGWLWSSIFSYALSILCKEHAVMVPAVAVMLAVWWRSSNEEGISIVQLANRHKWILLGYVLVAVYALLSVKHVVAYTYEPDATYSIDQLGLSNPWLLSVITQGYLFFKYMFIWMLPNPLWMSVDMREAFALSWISWPQTLGFCLFLLWPIVAIRLIWLSELRAVIGFAMVTPWLLFATELSTVRFNEIFVLYRSYLWIAPVFVIFLLLGQIKSRAVITALFILPIVMFPLAFNRISTFAHPFLLWNDAVRLVNNHEVSQGIGRTYYNRAIEFQRLGNYKAAITDFSKAISIEPRFYIAYAGRASAYAELKEFDKAFTDFDLAIERLPKYALIYENKSRALKELGRTQEATSYHQKACELGWKDNCKQTQELKTQ